MSLLKKAAEEREERVRDLHLDLPIPTWNKTLVGRFVVLDPETTKRFGKRDPTDETAAMDILIAATKELYLLDPDSEQPGTRMEGNKDYVRLEDEEGMPVRWDERLVLMLELDPAIFKTARDILVYCFKDNLASIMSFSLTVQRWISNTDTKVAEAIVGES